LYIVRATCENADLESPYLLRDEIRDAKDMPQEAKYVERWPNTTSAWAGWSRFDIPLDRYGGVHTLLICTSYILVSPTCH
jgi:hypothetical protein